jgi:hypothetical protein
MPTTQEILDAGMPPPDPAADPAEARAAAIAYGRAYLRVTGTPAAPSGYGTFLRRVPELLPRVPVTAGTCTVGPGAVMAVQELGGDERSLDIVLTREPREGEVRVVPQSNGTQVLTFSGGDTIIANVAVYLLGVPAEMVAALDAESTP